MSEIPNKLYRFYSLRPSKTDNKTGINSDLKFLEILLLSQNFTCKQFYMFNDPMEGMYKSKFTIYEKDIFKLKQSLYISCFTKDYKNPLMWSHYANGLQGIAIEIIVDKKSIHAGSIKKVIYSDTILEYTQKRVMDYDTVVGILTHKLKHWKYEKEFRFISSNTNYLYIPLRNTIKKINSCYIGKINKIFIGSPYQEAHNFEAIKKVHYDIEAYIKLKMDLMKYLNLLNIPYEVVSASDVINIKAVEKF